MLDGIIRVIAALIISVIDLMIKTSVVTLTALGLLMWLKVIQL
jgi:hypothetical protein